MIDIVEKIYNENKALIAFLEGQGEVSFKNEVDSKFKKVLLLSSASYFEYKIMDIIVGYVSKNTNKNDTIITFIKNKAISRQYHTYFNWEGNNANQFWGMFGEDFKRDVILEVASKGIQDSIKAFLEIGSLRNVLVHQNFASYYIDKTSEEIYQLHKMALNFISFLESKFI